MTLALFCYLGIGFLITWVILFIVGFTLCAFFNTPEPLHFEQVGFICPCDYYIKGYLRDNIVLAPFRITISAIKFRLHTKKCLAFTVNYGLVDKRWCK